MPIHRKRLAYWVALTVAFVGAWTVSTFQLFGVSRDFYEYQAYFDEARRGDYQDLADIRFEPAFQIVAAALTKVLDNNAVVYGLLAGTALAVKVAALRSVAPLYGAALVLYLFRFFPLHELTQIRAALALSFVLLAFAAAEANQRHRAVLFILVSVGLHYSAFLLAPFVFARFHRALYVIALGALAALVIEPAIPMLIEFAKERVFIIGVYADGGLGDDPANILSVAVLIDATMISLGLAMWTHSTALMRRIIVIQAIGLVAFIAFRDLPVIAHRTRELFSVLWILYVAQSTCCHRLTRVITMGFVTVCSIWYTFIHFFHSPLFSR